MVLWNYSDHWPYRGISEKLEKMDIGRVTHYAMIAYTEIYTRVLLTLTFQGERRRMSSGNSDGRDGAGEQVKENSNDVKIFIFYNLANFHRSKFRSLRRRCSRFSRSGFIWMSSKTRGESSSRWQKMSIFIGFLILFVGCRDQRWWSASPDLHGSLHCRSATIIRIDQSHGNVSKISKDFVFTAEFRDQLSAFSDFYSSLGPPNPGLNTN